MERDELADWLRLTETPGLGPVSVRRLLAAFGLPPAVFEATDAALSTVVGPAQVRALRAPPPGHAALVEATWAWLQCAGDGGPARRFAPLGDKAYPPALLAMADPPVALYLMGDRLPPAAAIAIVGTRHPTPQGAQNAHAFARHFAAEGLAVVSGLALGIDAAAHEGALEGAAAAGGGTGPATVAVVGTGLDRVYPRRHLALARRIAAEGLLVSEYPIGTPPLAANFPKRNRLIAGLSLGTLVVEAAQPSGSLITAQCAVEQGKDVFAIPGSIHNPQSRGCHALIRQGAKLVESAQDVREELRLPAATISIADGAGGMGAGGPKPSQTTADDDDPLLDALGWDVVGLDALVARTGIPTAELQVRLLELELDDQVVRVAGGLFQRVARA